MTFSVSMVSLQEKTLDNTAGAAFLGVVFASILFGITTVQTYTYYHAYPRDALFHKISVAVLWLLATIHQALVIHAVYVYIIKGFGNIEGLSVILWSIKAQVAINVIMILVVHFLYAYRVWRLSGYHRSTLGYIVVAMVVGGFVIGTVFTYQIFHVHTYAELDRVSWSIISSLATSTTIDFAIAAAMCFYLRKSKGEEQRLNTRISRVMQYTLNSGLLTSACSLSALFTYVLLPNTFVFVGLEFLLIQLYAGSFLAMLNARERKLPSPPDSDAEKGQNQATLTGGNQIQCISCKRQSGGSRASISTARLSPPPISTKATMGNMKEGMMSDATVVNTPHSRVESGSPSSFSKGKGVEAFGKASAKERGLVKSKLHVDVGGKYGAAKGRAMIVTTGSIEESPTESEIMEPSAALIRGSPTSTRSISPPWTGATLLPSSHSYTYPSGFPSSRTSHDEPGGYAHARDVSSNSTSTLVQDPTTSQQQPTSPSPVPPHLGPGARGYGYGYGRLETIVGSPVSAETARPTIKIAPMPMVTVPPSPVRPPREREIAMVVDLDNLQLEDDSDDDLNDPDFDPLSPLPLPLRRPDSHFFNPSHSHSRGRGRGRDNDADAAGPEESESSYAAAAAIEIIPPSALSSPDASWGERPAVSRSSSGKSTRTWRSLRAYPSSDLNHANWARRY